MKETIISIVKPESSNTDFVIGEKIIMIATNFKIGKYTNEDNLKIGEILFHNNKVKKVEILSTLNSIEKIKDVEEFLEILKNKM